MKLALTTALLLASVTLNSHSQISLPKVFSSHMVLQRDMPIHLWGTAAPGESIAVELHGVNVSLTPGDSLTADFNSLTATATADPLGRWSLYLHPLPAGGPYTLTLRAANTLQLDDILIGDLWIASGQSNMEMPLAGFPNSAVIKDSDKEIAAANHPEIRLLRVDTDAADYPLEDLKSATGWSRCTPETARSFSAVAYFFARDLQAHQHVPIGLIDSSWGGTPAEAWTSLDALGADAALTPVFAARATKMNQEPNQVRQDQLDKLLRDQGKPLPHRDWHPNPDSWRPAALYNAMIAPLTPLPIRGVIWYQGESNSSPDRVNLYEHLFSTMIQDWRTHWHQGDFPFLFVQISAFASTPGEHWGLLRDSQRHTLHLANTGMAVTLDAGDEHNVHPADKQIVGQRLALLARKVAFSEPIPASGPLFRLAYPDHATMRVWFNDATGLTAHGPTLQGFEIAGSDGNFVPAQATIEGDTVTATSPTITDPAYVRYAWPNFPRANLYNAAGLPASTFTSAP
jgi:sialate O-acetylesterase